MILPLMLILSCCALVTVTFMFSLICRPEELRVPFERYGAVRDVYLPKDYYTGYAFHIVSRINMSIATSANIFILGDVSTGDYLYVA